MTNYGGIIDVEVIFMLRIGTKEYYEAYAKISLIDIYNKKLISAKTTLSKSVYLFFYISKISKKQQFQLYSPNKGCIFPIKKAIL